MDSNTKYIMHRQGETFVVYDANLIKKKESKFPKKKLGSLFLMVSLISLLVFLSPILLAEFRYRFNQVSNQSELVDNGFGQLLWLDERGILSPDNWNFSLIIPKVKINAMVNDSVDLEEYETALKDGVAHARGTSFPDQSGTVFIFGHSTNYDWNIEHYSAYFYPLRYLEEGEEVIIIYEGENFVYKTVEKKIVKANEVEYLVSQNEEDKLVLQTCWPPGTTWKRLIVIAEPVNKSLTN